MEQIDVANTTEDAVREFMFVVEPADGEELQLEVDGVRRTLYLLKVDGLGYALRRIRAGARVRSR